MNTSGTKTRALCVATRCTSVDQFVATFHRFCGDDQSFFVATMTSRPIGLETAFSIQLADRQPVLRGLCIVLDAWETPENQYKRPGIRLGIKRLTADSQAVFDRLRAASKAAPTIAEATPAPGLPPLPPLPGVATVGTPTVPLRSTATPPPLPAVIVPRGGVASVRAGTQAPPEPLRPSSPTLVKPAATKPLVVFKSMVEPGARPPGMARTESRPFEQRPSIAPAPGPACAPVATERAPIAVTRFQVALKVSTIPPPVGDVESKPTQPIPRAPPEPRIILEPSRDEAPGDAGEPAMLVDRTSRPTARDSIDRIADDVFAQLGEPPPPEIRRPGSSLVLPANPLYDLSDASLEGFVDCTIYEESGTVFASGGGSAGIDDQPAAVLAARAPATVTAMPFAPPDLGVHTPGDTASPAVAAEALGSPPSCSPRPADPPCVVDAAMEVTGDARASPPVTVPPRVAPVTPRQPLAAPEPVAFPEPIAASPQPALALLSDRRRWRLLGGTAVVLIVAAFAIARLIHATPDVPREAAAAPRSPAATLPAAVDRTAAAAIAAVAAPPEVAPPEVAPAGAPPVAGRGTCRLAVATAPAASIVRLDDVAVGPSPVTLETTCDKHKLDVSHARYQSQTRWVTLTTGAPQALDVTLARPIHQVTVTSFPPGAELSIDGQRAGTTPAVVPMIGFATVNVTLTKPGFPSVTRKFYSKQAHDRVSVTLMK